VAENQKIKKKLPKRVLSPGLKARRAASWKRGQARKDERRREQAVREARNRELRAAGLPTPWEVANER